MDGEAGVAHVLGVVGVVAFDGSEEGKDVVADEVVHEALLKFLQCCQRIWS